MRRITFFLIFFMLFACMAVAQAPKSFNYQAVIRNESNVLVVNQDVSVRLSIIEGTISSEAIYIETHAVHSNLYGVIDLRIGEGDPILNLFDDIDWSAGSKFIKLEVDINGGSSYEHIGTSELLSVPYALHANAASKLGNNNVHTTNSDTLFVVKDNLGRPVFAVFPDGAKVIVDQTTKGSIGGFAVSGRTSGKATDENIFSVTPDSTTVYVKNTPGKGSIGGFAVSGRTSGKAGSVDILTVNTDSTRVYVGQTGKGSIGGFAVSGRTAGKLGSNDYFNVSGSSVAEVINNESRIMWYPQKSAFLAGEVHVGSADSVGTNSTALGYQSISMGDYSQAMGYKAVAKGDYSTAIGNQAIASSQGAFAFGDQVEASGMSSFAFGKSNVASGNYSTAFGLNTRSIGTYSFAIGKDSEASGYTSIAMGPSTLASDEYAFAVGVRSEAKKYSSFSIGSFTISDGWCSMALGSCSEALDSNSISLGNFSKSYGKYSMAFGINTMATAYASNVFGSYNVSLSGENKYEWVETDPIFVIGNGKDWSSRSNAITVLKNGNVGIGTINPSSYRLYIDGGNAYFSNDVSAETFTDRTPYPKDLKTAYDAVQSMKRLPDGEYQEGNKEHQLDHSTLHPFVTSSDGEHRDLSATVSAQNEVIKDLILINGNYEKDIKQLQKENEELKQKLNEIIELLKKN